MSFVVLNDFTQAVRNPIKELQVDSSGKVIAVSGKETYLCRGPRIFNPEKCCMRVTEAVDYQYVVNVTGRILGGGSVVSCLKRADPSEMLSAICAEDVNAIEQCVQQGFPLNEAQKFELTLDTPLSLAVRKGKKEAAKTLITLGADVNCMIGASSQFSSLFGHLYSPRAFDCFKTTIVPQGFDHDRFKFAILHQMIKDSCAEEKLDDCCFMLQLGRDLSDELLSQLIKTAQQKKEAADIQAVQDETMKKYYVSISHGCHAVLMLLISCRKNMAKKSSKEDLDQIL